MINIAGYIFKEENLTYSALTHSSYSSNNYERLEFLGDSILDFLVADILFKNQKFKEDELTRARAFIVSEENLCGLFDKLNLEKLVKIGKSCPTITRAIKGDIIESIIGLIYLNYGLDEARKFILNNVNFEIKQQKDYKTLLQEYAQKNKLSFEYEVEKTEGPAHNLTFCMCLKINDKIVSRASAKSKIDAEKECAKIALKNFNYKV